MRLARSVTLKELPLLTRLTVVGVILFILAELINIASATAQVESRSEAPVSLANSSDTIPPASLSSDSPREATVYQVGEIVEVFWGDQWWTARVLSFEGDRYCITYPGWDSSWDECVSSDRMRAVTDPEAALLKAEADRVNQAGLSQSTLGQFQAALPLFQQALEIYRSIHDGESERITLNNIGIAYQQLGEHSLALEHYEQALIRYRDIGNREGEGTTLNNIGSVYEDLGQYPLALDSYQQALIISREEGNRDEEGSALNNTGQVYTNLGEYSPALVDSGANWPTLCHCFRALPW